MRSNQSILKEISLGCSLEGLMLKLKLQYFGHLMGRADSFEKTLMLGKMRARGEGDNRGWDGWMASLTQWTWVCVNSGSWWWTGRLGVLQFMGLQKSDMTEQLNWSWDSLIYSLLWPRRPNKVSSIYIICLQKSKYIILCRISFCDEMNCCPIFCIYVFRYLVLIFFSPW